MILHLGPVWCISRQYITRASSIPIPRVVHVLVKHLRPYNKFLSVTIVIVGLLLVLLVVLNMIAAVVVGVGC